MTPKDEIPIDKAMCDDMAVLTATQRFADKTQNQ